MTLSSALSHVLARKPVLATESVERKATAPKPDRSRDYPRLLFWLTVVFLAIGVLARVTRYAVAGPMWGDECMLGLNIIQRDFAGLTRMLDHMQTAPILFLWSERAAYLALGSSELALRALPFLAGTLGLMVFWDFAHRAVSPLAALMAVGILAVSRWPVSMASTFKPYASDLFFAALLMNLAQRWRNEPGKRWPLLALVLATPISLSSSYTAVFIAGGVSLYLLPIAWAHPSRWARGLFVAFNMVMVATFAGNYLLHIHGQLEEQGRALETFMRGYWADGFPQWTMMGFLKWMTLIHTGRLFAYPVGDANGGSVISFLVFLIGITAALRSKHRAVLVLCLVPFALNFLAAAMGKYPYGGCCRLSQHLAPAICLILGIALAAMIEYSARSDRSWIRRVAVMGVILLSIGLWQMAVDLAAPNHDAISTWSRQLHRELTRHMKPGDRVILASPRIYMDDTTEWQLCRLGDRLSWQMPDDLAADAPRIWIVCNVRAHSEFHLDDDAVKVLGPGRVEVGRAVYSIPAEHDLLVPWQFTMICLAKPEHAGEKLIFRCSP